MRNHLETWLRQPVINRGRGKNFLFGEYLVIFKGYKSMPGFEILEIIRKYFPAINLAFACSLKGPSTLVTLFSHRWPRFCGGDIYSRRKPLFSSFGEHTAVCGSSVRQAVARSRHRQSVFVAAFGSEHTSDCSCGMWQPLIRVGNFAEYGNFAGG